MRHGDKINNLSRTASHRKALLSNLTIALITNKRIITTLAKAKALRTFVVNAVETELPNSVSYDEVWYLDDYQRLYFFDYYLQNLIDTLEELNLPEEKAAFEALHSKVKP